MSFGASPSDIIILVTFCKTLYRKCKEAGGEYLEISREVRGLHTVLRHLKYEVEAPESVLNRDRSTYGRELAPIIGDCDYTLCMLDGLLQKYGRLGDTSPSSPRVLWDKIRFGSNEMDELGGIRVKLISHKTSLTLFLDTIQLHQSGKVEKTLDLQNGQLDKILDKVDGIASRMGHRAGSVMTSYDDDDKEVWKQFRRELVAEGFDSAVLHKHKDVLRAYIREIDQDGLLDDIPREIHNHPSPGVNPERWLDHVHSETSDDPPPSFRTFETNTTDDSTKELAAREDNMKFPQSIKAERGKTQSMKVGHDVQNKLNVPNWNLPKGRTGSDGSQRHLSPVPKLITSSEKEPLYQNTSGSESDDSDSGASESKKGQFGSSELALVIHTSDLTSGPSNMALQVRPSGSPSSYRSQASFTSFTDEEVPRSMVFRPKSSLDYESSPPHNGALSIPQSQKVQDGRSSPRQTPIRLAPDQNGNEIPADAKWTRIKRSLVSPEVLAQDRRRYEARPDFVAVLGVLTREEIQGYAARSYALREARHREHQKRQNPAYLPRPSPIPIPRSPENNRQSRYTPSEDSSDSADEDRHQRPRYTEHRTYPGSPTPSYTHVHQSGYPNPYGVRPPPSPALSSSSNLTPQSARLPQHSPRESHSHHHSSHRERERRESRRRHTSPSRQPSQTKVAEKEKNKSRWKENLSAGAVGGAAFSLLHVLAEAAEGL